MKETEKLKFLIDPNLQFADEEALVAYAKASLISTCLPPAPQDRQDPTTKMFWVGQAKALAYAATMRDRHYRNKALWQYRKGLKDLRYAMK